ncbi:hypothetical protein Tco_0030621 [Tanacetum coccineum]
MPRTDFNKIPSNESSPVQNHLTNTSQPLKNNNTTIATTLDTSLALTFPPSNTIQTTLAREPLTSPLATRALTFSTPPSSPLEPHPYLSSLNEIPPRTTNPLPQVISQGLFQTLPQPSPMNFEPTFPPINLSRSRLSARPEPSMTRDQIHQELSQLHTLKQTSKKPSKTHNKCKKVSFLLPPSPPYKCHHHSIIPLPQLKYHPLEHHSLYQPSLPLLINPFGLKTLLDLKFTHAPIAKEPKPLSITSKMK